jgi:hypothetical protein
MMRKCFAYGIVIMLCASAACTTKPERKPLAKGTKVILSANPLSVKGQIPMYGGNILLFKAESHGWNYLQYFQQGNLSLAGGLLFDKNLLPAGDRRMNATIINYVPEDEGPSQVQIDLNSSLPSSFNKENWKPWETCWVFNSQIELPTAANAVKLPPEPPKPKERPQIITVQLGATAARAISKRIVIKGKTNLPQETQLLISLRDANKRILDQDKVAVGNDGQFSSGEFSDGGSPHPPGTYYIDITCPISSTQPEAVQKLLGGHGEFMKGPLVTKAFGLFNIAQFNQKVEIK